MEKGQTVTSLFSQRWSLRPRLGLAEAAAGRGEGFSGSGGPVLVGCVVSSLDRKGREEGARRAVLRTSLSLVLKMDSSGKIREWTWPQNPVRTPWFVTLNKAQSFPKLSSLGCDPG